MSNKSIITLNYSNHSKGWNKCRFYTFVYGCLNLGDRITYLSTEHGSYAIFILTDNGPKRFSARTYFELAEVIIQNKDVMLTSAKQGGDALRYASEMLKRDKDIIKAATGTFTPYTPGTLTA